MTHFRLRFKVRGGRTHISLFVGRSKDTTHGKCGDLVMANDEWIAFRAFIEAGQRFAADFEFAPGGQEGEG